MKMMLFDASYKSNSFLSSILMEPRRMRRAGHVAGMGEKRNAYRISVGKPDGKRPRRRWDDNIKMDLREVVRDGMDWIDLAQDRDR
jgi:hypothetical protein